MSKKETIEKLETELKDKATELARLRFQYNFAINDLASLQRRNAALDIERDRALKDRDALTEQLAEVRKAAGTPPAFVPVGKVVRETPLAGLGLKIKADLGSPIYEYVSSPVIRVGQVRQNRDYKNTEIRVIAPPRRTMYGTDDTWLVEYLNTGRSQRRSSAFIRAFYLQERVVNLPPGRYNARLYGNSFTVVA